ncbi:MAG: UDP-galactopyranose mutase [Proteobacteria bacterium]|nr:MAG: UDP-galactopyranose mutase [Pseudomonadota bacterium]
MKKIAFAGAGFACAVLARELAESGKFKCVLFDEREHIAGNCHTEKDPETGITIHKYGPHIFHTSNADVWKYVNRFGEWKPFTNRVKAHTDRGVFSLPLNLLTINQFFKKSMSPTEAKAFVSDLGDSSIDDPQTFEDQALRFVGKELYENFFEGYTTKQWGVSPRELPASILKRLPLRFNYDDNYYASTFQGMPKDGYTAVVAKILDHPAIEVKLKTRFTKEMAESYDHTFWSGPLDAWFGFDIGKLRYRSLEFKRFDGEGDYQGNAVINYCSKEVPFTRIAEHKHFAPWEAHDKTVYFKEFSKLAEGDDIPYYPLRLVKDTELLNKYFAKAKSETKVSFIGRLGTYRYMDMHQIIGESLEISKRILKADNGAPIPSLFEMP